MKVNSVNTRTAAACPNRPQNFGAILLTQQGEKALRKFSEAGLPNSLENLIGQAVFSGKINSETATKLLGLQKGDVLVLNKEEVGEFEAQLASGDNNVYKAIQGWLSNVYRFDVERVLGLKKGQTLIDVVRAKLFSTEPRIKDVTTRRFSINSEGEEAPIKASSEQPEYFKFDNASHPIEVVGNEHLFIDDRHLAVNEEIEKIRGRLFRLAESKDNVRPEFLSSEPTACMYGVHIADIAKRPPIDEFGELADTIKERNPLLDVYAGT